MGAANLAAGLFQGFAISVSGSRTAVAEQSGAKSQVTGLVGAGLVAVLLLFLNSLLADLPQTTLAAVVIVAALSLMDFAILGRYSRVRKSALALSLVATGGVVLFGVLWGIAVAVILAILLFFRRSWWPHGSVLGRVEGVSGGTASTPTPTPAPRRGSSCFAGRRPSSLPTPAGFATQVRRLCATSGPPGSCCSARPSPTSTSPPPTCSSGWTKSSTPRGPPGVRRAAQPAAGPDSAVRTLRDPRPRPFLPDPRGRHRPGRGARAPSRGR